MSNESRSRPESSRPHHTPGPWAADVELRDHGGWKPETQNVTVRAGQTIIASYYTSFVEYPDDATNEANARLIAAAPDYDDLVANLLNAIDSGNLQMSSPEIDPGDGHEPFPWHEAWLRRLRAAHAKARGVQPQGSEK